MTLAMLLFVTLLCAIYVTMTSASQALAQTITEDIEIEQFPVNLQHKGCMLPLGMESGNITDDHIFVSSSLGGIKYGKEEARLNGNSAWMTRASIKERWIQVDFVGQRMVSGVQTQGFSIHWISAYQVQYKVNLVDLHWKSIKYGFGSEARVFLANFDGSSIVTNTFTKPVQAETVRIIPTNWPRNFPIIALRFELLGCQVEQSGCDSPRVVTRPSGFLSSMNHPQNYDNNANCLWEITAPEGQTIILEFRTFALEGFNKNCPLEYVEVYDVVGASETTMGKFCGKTTPPKFVSTSNLLKVRFMSDHFESDVGFKAFYRFYNGSGCGGPRNLNDQQGSFHSINYPRNYNSNANCSWDITVDDGKLIEVTFVDFHVTEGSTFGRRKPRCAPDALKINNVGSGSGDVIAKGATQYCGHNLPSNFVSSSNRLHVTFQSDNRFTDRGFNATYKAVVPSGCGKKRDLTATTGVIQSMNYPLFYAKGLLCEWNIVAQGTSYIQLTFHNFELEEDNDCRYDHVSIYDGLSDRYLLGKYCNRAKIQPLVAHSGSMKIIFVSDNYNHHSGFNATYVIKPFTTTTHVSTTSSKDTTVFTTIATSTTQMKMEESSKPNPVTAMEQTTDSTIPTPVPSKKPLDVPNPSNGPGTVITQETAKWIITGLAAVSGVLVILVLLGIILCCRQQLTGKSVIVQGSFKEANNSSVMQNHAYDFDFPSTNHSIRSRQVERPETQVSETLSQQGTLRRAPSRESHIYFSIEEYGTTRGKQDIQVSNKNLETPSVKVHFKKHTSEPKLMGIGSDESTTMQSEDDIDADEYTDDGEDSNTIIDDSAQETDEPGRSSRSNTIERKYAPCKNFAKTKSSGESSKMMVDNILYESADSMDQDN